MAGYSSASWAKRCALNGCITKDTPPPFNLPYTTSGYTPPNRVVDWIASWDKYRIPVPYDGYSSTAIRFCPMVRVGLPASRREEWYRVLHGMGYSDPGGDDGIPPEFESDEWWRSGG